MDDSLNHGFSNLHIVKLDMITHNIDFVRFDSILKNMRYISLEL
ncbi:34_t:CDS:2 [Ambispora leptoticha]|uniref:34_t:CDS:1 n=1 Tax=Ambispora leptoticha TaxID=144679 RepID=A0A9N9FX32_9GLOM|nr:34_t:CDS:2 [Ambispora leptoticha]